ncbi:lead, cadmium, zinc and mercury transporting ATPase [Lentilactobacillus farraginis DSM 18382 = JCM 14108]|uniref:Lead, cadmium, zinc and mercury transporting ATPase n=1 Tax=Lentilactobacillus farraginis DSM 18382 = JCM 14108 TaxID=1423743 RepID=X0PH98_9LACO|nr:lead, cadmium, zinc and mercury transporting ATPase [Lentilactobacillus farraginis DSM 18382 = JCM 14108]
MKTSSADQMNKMQAQSEKEKSLTAQKTPMSGQHHMTMQHDSMTGMDHQMGGMDMSDDHQMSGMHGHHMNMNMGDLNRRFWISLVLTVPVVLLSPMAGMKA